MRDRLSFRRDMGWGERIALLTTSLALSICMKLALKSHVEGQLLFVSMFVVVVNALYGGFVMGLLAALLTAATHGILFFRPEMRLGIDETALIIEGISYLSIACLLAYLGGRLRVVQRQMRDAFDARESLMAVLAHDLRNPLAAIKMSAELLSRRRIPGDLQVSKLLGSILQATDSMDGLISSILDFERAKTGKLELQLDDVSLESLAGKIRNLLDPVAQRRSIVLRVKAIESTGNFRIRCDERRILQVFLNLIGNAIKFSHSGGEVRVVIEPKPTEGVVTFAISDDGPGISKEDQMSIYRKGWQKDETSQKGIGLGLWIVRSVLSAHEVDLKLESEPGKGTTFRFSLPIAVPEAEFQSA